MKFRKFLMLLLAITVNTFSQTTSAEKQFFDNFKKDSIHYDLVKGLSFIDASYSDKTYLKNKRVLDDFIKTLPKKGKTDKREKKRIKKIYDLVHKEFFKKHDENVFFNDVFTSKTYNCVTATALYVYIFEELKVPYHIKEMPSHVFLIAYPNKYRIHLETTVPGAYGFYIPKDSEVIKMVDELINTKLLTKEEVNKKGYNKTYLDYFYGKKHVDKSKLIGMQYYNKAVFNYNKEELKAGFENIIKSFVFYKNPYSKAILAGMISQGLIKMDLNDISNIEILFNAIKLLEFEKEIDKYTIELLLYKIVTNDKNDLDFIESLIPELKELNQEPLELFCIDYITEYLASEYLEKNNFDKAIQYCEYILKKNPNNKKMKSMITFAIFKKYYISKINEKILITLNGYIKEYPFLFKDRRIVSLLTGFYAQMVQNNYYLRDEKKAYDYFLKFDSLIKSNKELVQLNPEYVAQIYLIAGKYYYGSNKFVKAKEIFEKGVEYYPEHPGLTKKLKWTIEDMQGID